MRLNQSTPLSSEQRQQAVAIGEAIARLRVARRVRQSEAALRAGVSRNTAYRLEKGDPGVALGQLLRYVDAIAPGLTLAELVAEKDPSLKALQARERTRRVRAMSAREASELDF